MRGSHDHLAEDLDVAVERRPSPERGVHGTVVGDLADHRIRDELAQGAHEREVAGLLAVSVDDQRLPC